MNLDYHGSWAHLWGHWQWWSWAVRAVALPMPPSVPQLLLNTPMMSCPPPDPPPHPPACPSGLWRGRQHSWAQHFNLNTGTRANSYTSQLGLGDISHAIITRILSVKPVSWLAVNLHHLLSNGAAVNTQSRSSLTSYAISRPLSQMNRLQ